MCPQWRQDKLFPGAQVDILSYVNGQKSCLLAMPKSTIWQGKWNYHDYLAQTHVTYSVVPGLVLVCQLLVTSPWQSAEIEIKHLETFILSWLSNCYIFDTIKIGGSYFVGLHLRIPAPVMHKVTLSINKNGASIREEESEGWPLGRVPTVWAMQKMMGMMLLLEVLENSRQEQNLGSALWSKLSGLTCTLTHSATTPRG